MSDTSEDYFVKGWPVLTESDLRSLTQNLEYGDEDLVVTTSSEEPKRIAYSAKDKELIAERGAQALNIAGLEEYDVMLNLGAPQKGPEPHISGWIGKHAPEYLGCKVPNNSVADYEKAIENGEELTAVGSLPRAVMNIGSKISAEQGDVEEVFPNMRLAITGGEELTEEFRQKLIEQWGLEDAKSTYANTEFGLVAAENEENKLISADDNLIIEILEEGAEIEDGTGKAPEDKIYNINEIDEPVTGSILISDPERERLPLIRYEIGDLFTAHPREEEPHLEYKSRTGRVIKPKGEDGVDVINVSGHLAYPSDITAAVDGKCRTVVSEPEEFTEIDIYAWDTDMDGEEILENLREERSNIDTWEEIGGLTLRAHVKDSREEVAEELEKVDLVDELLGGGKKTKRVGFHESYQER